jgi:hypothetical protein
VTYRLDTDTGMGWLWNDRLQREGKGGSVMTSIVLHSTSGPDGKLHLEVPVGSPNTEFEVEVVVRAKKPGGILLPPRYFDLIGSIDDETFVRPPQGELPPPVEIDVRDNAERLQPTEEPS